MLVSSLILIIFIHKMEYEEVFEKLSGNPKNVRDEAVRLIIKIADNITRDPTNQKIRSLQKSNGTISSKILPTKGAVECLKMMGFQETQAALTIPSNIPIYQINEVKNALLMWQESMDTQPITDGGVKEKEPAYKPDESATNHKQSNIHIKPIVLPPLVSIFSNPFLKQVENYFHNCLQYENNDLQVRARKLIPVVTLEEAAQRRLRVLQEYVKKNQLLDKNNDPELSIQDTLIIELLRWFKDDFFSWVDSPDCSSCGGKTRFSHMSTDRKHLIYTNRVELHRCEVCQSFTPFPRYNDLNILLETRKGRCGEWANTFTLFCRAMSWDARFVVEQGDHVWTEVYSVAQKRWLHCDPCENICDTPLVYESGWHKKISYVMAYSGDEVQDVTWRYSSNHKDVLKRRNKCSEKELIDGIIKLRSIRQNTFSEPRRNFLTKRLLGELVELMVEKKPSAEDAKGRSSGSAAWKLTRGEIQEVQTSSYVWKITDEHTKNNKIVIRYSASLDKYEFLSGESPIQSLEKWHAGAYSNSNMLRKEEKDWKQVYLARNDGVEVGVVSWKVEINCKGKTLDVVAINFDHATFENGEVNLKLSSDGNTVEIPKCEKVLTTNNFKGKKCITITATLSGGKGDVAWQHAQIFRQPMDSKAFPFSITLFFK